MVYHSTLVLLKEQLRLAQAARDALNESYYRATPILSKSARNVDQAQKLSVEERETLEALTSRFARLSDFIFQRLFRTLDQIELTDEGSGLDRLNRMEKRGILESEAEWRSLRQLRNDIVHEYLIEASDEVVKEVFRLSPQLIETVNRVIAYAASKKYSPPF